MYLAAVSNPTTLAAEPSTDPIYLVTQFYLPSNPVRLAEVREALQRNAANPHLAGITLLNERVYTEEELGVSSAKISQKVVPHRVKFNELFANRHDGYTVVANADIFLDETIANLRASDLHLTKKIYALLRYEFTSPVLKECPLFGPRADSADTWIFHHTHRFPLNLFNFEMGRPGCDNKINYLFKLAGFDVYNDPAFIRTYHCHRDRARNYGLPAVDPPYMLLWPHGAQGRLLGRPISEMASNLDTYDMEKGNDRLYEHLCSKLESGKPFVVPRVAGVENNAAVFYAMARQKTDERAAAVLKNNAGVDVRSESDLRAFSEWYLRAFTASDLYASWEPWGHYVKHIEQSQAYVQARFPKPQISAGVFDVFHFIAGGRPWTHALRGKKILIVSPFGDLFQRQSGVFPIDLFPECTLGYMKPPMTQGSEGNRGFATEFADFCARVRKQDFDVALCACGGYGNPICAFIYSMGKAAIYVGGVLQMYYGVYGARWIKERKDVLNMYMTPKWTRPSERPKGYEQIENGCYW